MANDTDRGSNQTVEEQLRNIRNAVRFLAESLQGLAESVGTTTGVEYTAWAGEAIDKVDEKLNHD
jgi:hypothetical protein